MKQGTQGHFVYVQQPREKKCGCCKVLCCICCSLGICCSVVILIIAVLVGGYFWFKPQLPSAGVASTDFEEMNLTSSPIKIDVKSTLWIDNPNRWPFTGSIVSATADMYSRDKKSPSGEIYFIGQAKLPQSVTIATNANTSFSVEAKDEMNDNSAQFSQRLKSDCGGNNDRSTMLEFNLTGLSVELFGRKVDLVQLLDQIPQFRNGATYSTLVPCPKINNAQSDPVKFDDKSGVHEGIVVV